MQQQVKISLLVLSWFVCFGCSPAPQKICGSDDVCNKDEICENQACILGCRKDEQCSPGFRCIDKKCTNKVCLPNEKRDCYDGVPDTKGKGPCQGGFQLCKPDGTGWSPCYEQVVPVSEICDSVDNDCNGLVDENLTCDCNPGDYQRCYTGPTGTNLKGLCRSGVQYCTAQRKWGPCQDQSQPRREICDGLDNDCNGLIDDNINCTCTPGAVRECYSGPDGTAGIGVCRKGQQTCNPQGQWNECFGQTLPGLEEEDGKLCNGQDDNCDGTIDNVSGTKEPLKRSCYSGPKDTNILAPCKLGSSTCTNKQWGPCTDEIIPKSEECNNQDDDCNGNIDDIPPQACFTGKTGCVQVGASYVCKGGCTVGQRSCENGQWTPCKGEILPQDKEICGDGLDNDCNGLVDDQCVCATGQKQACYTGPQDTRNRGSCKDGEQLCTNNQWGPCQNAALPTIEICDNLDNNCDGIVDNIADLKQPCTDPQRKGECRNGITLCKETKPGQWEKVCEATTQAAPAEECNGKDEDCDGTVDNIADLKQACIVPQAKGNCSVGEWQCVLSQGQYSKTCVSTKPAKAEICNGEDDDCDGIVDNIGTPCIVQGQLGRCLYGRTLCQQTVQNGQTVWQGTCQAAPSLPETCNGQDDDCNGKIDDIPDLGKACSDPARKGNCSTGAWACVTDAQGTQKTCLPTVSPTAEICNGQDDDCDGISDNVLGVCTVIDPKIQGPCRQGTRTCSFDPNKQIWIEACTPKSATSEICNGVDDDCNGKIDDVQGVGNSCIVPNLLGVCGVGVTQCNNGKVACVSKTPLPLNEICNNEDDDCDGKIDNGIPDRPCQTPCGKGTESCLQGQWINCTAAIPQPEGTSCNGKDDDCDGKIDNFGPCVLSNFKGKCAQGEKRCDSQNQIVCVQVYQPVLEVGCNGEDDDCNGQIDETYPHAGKLCVLSNAYGLLGVMSCVNGLEICTPPARTEFKAPGFVDAPWIPPGTFLMGDANKYQVDATPTFQATLLQPFAMQPHETRWGDFKQILSVYELDPLRNLIMSRLQGECKGSPPAQCPAFATWHLAALYANQLSKAENLSPCYACNPDYSASAVGNAYAGTCVVHPAWNAQRYTQCPGYRLPTEAEWEFAYRANTTSDFYTGLSCSNAGVCSNPVSSLSATEIAVMSIAWFTGNTACGSDCWPTPKIVGQKTRNAWGLADMAGNIQEWVYDWYDSYPASPQISPSGPNQGTYRVLRGGHVSSSAISIRASSRSYLAPSIYNFQIGFRLVRSILRPFYCQKDSDCSALPGKTYTCNNQTCVSSP